MARSSASHLHLDERRCRRGGGGRGGKGKEGRREWMCQGSLGGAVSLLSSPTPSEGEEKKIWMKGDVVVVAAAAVGGGGVDSRASVCPFAHHIKCMGSPWQRRK